MQTIIVIDRSVIEQVISFTYLRVDINSERNWIQEVQREIFKVAKYL